MIHHLFIGSLCSRKQYRRLFLFIIPSVFIEILFTLLTFLLYCYYYYYCYYPARYPTGLFYVKLGGLNTVKSLPVVTLVTRHVEHKRLFIFWTADLLAVCLQCLCEWERDTHTHTHRRTHTQAHTHAHTHRRTHTCTHTGAHTRAHTHYHWQWWTITMHSTLEPDSAMSLQPHSVTL